MRTVGIFSCAALSPQKVRAVFSVDFPEFLFSVDIRLVNGFRSSPAPVVAPGAELAVDPARTPQRLINDPFPLFPRGIFDQNGFHILSSRFFTSGIRPDGC